MAQQNIEAQGAERREFFRIEDEVVLSYRVTGEEELDALIRNLREGMPNRFSASANFMATSRQMNGLLRKIHGQTPDLARYLEALDRKLNMLAQLFVVEEIEHNDQPTREVSLSAGGMSFQARGPLVVGDHLEVKLVLFPSLTGILTVGSVVYCEKLPQADAEFPYRVAVEFSSLQDNERDLLVKHILNKQTEQLRRERELEPPEQG